MAKDRRSDEPSKSSDSQPENPWDGQPWRPLFRGTEARAEVERLVGYDTAAARDWLERAIREKRVRAWHGEHVSWQEYNPACIINMQPVRESDFHYGVPTLANISIDKEEFYAALEGDFQTFKPSKQAGLKRGAKEKEIWMTIVIEAAIWIYDEDLKLEERGALQKVRDFIEERLSMHNEDASSESIRKWANAVIDVMKGRNTSN